MSWKIDPTKTPKGSRFGMLSVIGVIPGSGGRRVFCACDCGVKRIMYRGNILYSGVDSCGCRSREKTTAGNRVHGLAGTPTYRSWTAMKRRCHSPKSDRFHYYGGAGVTVCDRWQNSFAAFLEDMGNRPPGCTLDRIDSSKGYSPENCRWADRKTQSRNRSFSVVLTVDGRSRPVPEWAEIYGIAANVIHARIRLGWTVEDAVKKPMRGAKRAIAK